MYISILYFQYSVFDSTELYIRQSYQENRWGALTHIGNKDKANQGGSMKSQSTESHGPQSLLA